VSAAVLFFVLVWFGSLAVIATLRWNAIRLRKLPSWASTIAGLVTYMVVSKVVNELITGKSTGDKVIISLVPIVVALGVIEKLWRHITDVSDGNP
jgi:hypothetical protein